MARYRRRRTFRKRNRYSVETRVERDVAFVDITGEGKFPKQAVVPIVNSTNVEGVRKCKNFTLNLDAVTTSNASVYWALVYVQESVGIGELNSTGELYKPSQNLIASGILTQEMPPRIFSRMSRNVNKGDSIYLVLGSYGASAPPVNIMVKYAICFN